VQVKEDVKSVEMRAVVIGADGKPKKDLGVISYYHRNPLKRAVFKIKQLYLRIEKWLQS